MEGQALGIWQPRHYMIFPLCGGLDQTLDVHEGCKFRAVWQWGTGGRYHFRPPTVSTSEIYLYDQLHPSRNWLPQVTTNTSTPTWTPWAVSIHRNTDHNQLAHK